MIKSITARKMVAKKPQAKEELWGGEFWSKGYYIDTVGKHASEDVMAKYFKDQGRDKEYANYSHSSSTFFIPRSLRRGSSFAEKEDTVARRRTCCNNGVGS